LVELDGLRGIAVLLVLLFHIGFIVAIDRGRAVPMGSLPDPAIGPPGLFETIVARGYVGVLVFFVLSGFLIGRPFIRWRVGGGTPVRAAPFLLRRLQRIEPPYIVAMIAAFMLVRVISPAPTIQGLGASLLDIHQLVYGFGSPENAPAWSLEVEMQWYLVVPLIAVILSSSSASRRYVVAGSLIAIALVLQLTVGLQETRTDATVLAWLQFFLAGWLVADVIETRGDGRGEGKGWRWDIASLAGWAMLFAIVGHWSLQLAIAPALIALLLVAALRGTSTRAMLRSTPLQRIGRISFSIYLVHYPIFLLVRWAVGPLPGSSFGPLFLEWTLLLAPITLVVASGFFAVVEQPFLERTWPRWVSESWTRVSVPRNLSVTR